MKLAIALALLLAPAVALGQEPAPGTAVIDEAAAKKLLGPHGLTLQWITYGQKDRGQATVSAEGGVYRLTGEQRDAKGNFVTVAGTITRIERTDFHLEGTIVTRTADLAKGEPCTRKGKFRFHIKGARKFWRLQEMANDCAGGGVVDYVDLHFAAK